MKTTLAFISILFITFSLFAQKNKKNKIVKLDNIYFDKNQFNINGDTKITLDYNISELKTHSKIHIILYGHIDNLESETNKNIHKQRLKSTLHYIEKKGIDLNRIYVSEELHHHETKLYFGSSLGGDLKNKMDRKIVFKTLIEDPEQDEMVVSAYTYLNKHHDEIHNIILYAKQHPNMDLNFKIQISALSNATQQKLYINHFPDIKVTPFGNGLFRYTTGKFDDIHDAVKKLTAVQQKGYYDAFIILYREGKFIHPEEIDPKTSNYK